MALKGFIGVLMDACKESGEQTACTELHRMKPRWILRLFMEQLESNPVFKTVKIKFFSIRQNTRVQKGLLLNEKPPL